MRDTKEWADRNWSWINNAYIVALWEHLCKVPLCSPWVQLSGFSHIKPSVFQFILTTWTQEIACISKWAGNEGKLRWGGGYYCTLTPQAGYQIAVWSQDVPTTPANLEKECHLIFATPWRPKTSEEMVDWDASWSRQHKWSQQNL